MRLSHGLLACAAALGIIVGFCGFAAQQSNPVTVPVIVTAAPAYDPLAGVRGSERFPRGAHLLRIERSKAEPLLPGFAASADASISFDGKKILFAGKKTADEPWGIWELTLADGAVRKVMGDDADLVRPLYLPDDRLVYARRGQHGFQMESAQLDGTAAQALTFMPGSAIPEDVLADGRILFESTYPLGEGTTPEMYLVYTDGSGIESYRCDHGAARWGGRQVSSGDVVFTEGKMLARFTSPLATEVRVAAPPAKYAGGVVEVNDHQWLVSARPEGGNYALQLWNPGAAALKPFLATPHEDLVDPVLLRERVRPHRHPSGLHGEFSNLLALNARESREGDLKAAPASVRLEIKGAHGNAVAMGSAPVESDGSFFLKAPPETPIRFALLDAHGAVIRQEHGWFWIRSGEQRICVGCHTGPERGSENRVPAVLLRTTAPVDLTGASKPTALGSR